ncbi:hypothetical protein JCM10449v2_003389 [Rhodotorula kratochvilovae]
MAHRVPPGAHPHAAELVRLESVIQSLETAIANDSSISDVLFAVGAAFGAVSDASISASITTIGKLSSTASPAELTQARASLQHVRAFVRGRLEALREIPTQPLPDPSSAPSTVATELQMQRDVSRILQAAAAVKISKTTRETDLIRQIYGIYESTPQWVKEYKTGPPGNEKPALSPREMLRIACMSDQRFAHWWEIRGKDTPWEDHLRIAKAAISAIVLETEEQTLQRFDEVAQTFDWSRKHENDQGDPVLACIQYAAKLSEVLTKAESFAEGRSGWYFASSAMKHLPHWLAPYVILSMDDRKDTMKVLKAISTISKDAFTRHEQEIEEQDRRFRQIVGEARGNLQRNATYPPAQPQRQQQQSTPAHPLTFEDTADGEENYKKAVVSFIKAHPSLTPPLSVKFPLTLGTLSVPSTACHRCGHKGHIASECSSSNPVLLAKRNYHRLWRTIEARSRGGRGPSWLNNGLKAVNLIGDVDELMADHADDGTEDDGQRNGDENRPAEEASTHDVEFELPFQLPPSLGTTSVTQPNIATPNRFAPLPVDDIGDDDEFELPFQLPRPADEQVAATTATSEQRETPAPDAPPADLSSTLEKAKVGALFKHRARAKGPKRFADVVVTVDDGAECNVADAAWFDSWAYDLELEREDAPAASGIRLANNSVQRLVGLTTIRLQVGLSEEIVRFRILDSGGTFQLLLGKPWKSQVGAIHFYEVDCLMHKTSIPGRWGRLWNENPKTAPEFTSSPRSPEP